MRLDSLSWKWETYSQYLADLDRQPKGLNVGGMIGHSALRRYAMGIAPRTAIRLTRTSC